MSKVVAITVTYHPQADVFLPLLNQLLLQTAQVIVVDNTPGRSNSALAALIERTTQSGALRTDPLGREHGHCQGT